jgi:lipopolysaccharide heptosyltransferase I
MPRPRRAPRRLLIVRLSALGDVIHVLPALDALRRALPEAHIAWLVEDRAATLLAGHPQLDRVHVLPRARLAATLFRERRPLAAAEGLAAFFGALRRERFDTAIDFQGNLRSGLATLLSGARRRVGFGRGFAKEGSHLLTNVHVAGFSRRSHKVERNLALVAALGIDTAGARARIAVPPDARARAAAFLAPLGPGPFVAIHPGVSKFGAFKQWAPERYAEVARALAARRAARAVVTWGPGERELALRVVSLSEGAAALGPETASLLDLAALFERCAAVAGCDTGPVHLAAALGVEVIGLYGPKDPRIYGPWVASRGGPAEVIWKHVHCSPCTLRWCGNVICMDAIGPGEVAAALERAVAHATGTPRSAPPAAPRP